MQRMAIDTRDRTLLVSAAAGSGKTATLTERIISSLLDSERPMKIENMLIVTFTNAAVGELRDRISAALKKAIAEHPENKELERQLLLLPGAKICTIDSFCSDILRANCERVGVNPGYRIADGAEAELIAERVLDGIFEAVYDGRLPEVASADELEELADCLTEARSVGDLALNVRLIYKELESSEEGVHTFGRLRREFDTMCFVSPERTTLGAYLMKKVHAFASHYRRILDGVRSAVSSYADVKLAKIDEILLCDLDFLRSIEAAEDYETVRGLFLGYEMPRSVSVPSAYKDALPDVTAIRRSMRSEMDELNDGVFYSSGEDILRTYDGLYRVLGILERILEKFHTLFLEEKLSRGICQYSDVERFTYECLWQDGERTDIAVSESKRFDAVYIDEYQDVNSLQNKIFEAISRPDNRFMVGDIKQSIYRFRSANPDIFASMKASFPEIDSEDAYPEASIFMSENFRSDKGVIDYVNSVFDRLFTFVKDSIGYTDGDRLRYAKVYPSGEPEYKKPELCIVDKETDAYVKALGLEGIDGAAPIVVAQKIKELLKTGRLSDGRAVRPSDIAIILRNTHGKDSEYARALELFGIPSVKAEDKTFFMNSEVLLALCLLNSIDNPRRDVYLGGLMCSPLCGFRADDLTRIRTSGGECLYESLLNYVSENPEYFLGRSFLNKLEKYRTLAEGTSVDVLVGRLYHETGLMSLAASKGTKEYLLLLYEHARKFESGSYKGLYNFLSYINSILERKSEFDKRRAPEGENAVRIITAHSSKGLEYPIVFFAEAEQRLFNNRDSQPRVIMDEKLGVGMYLRTPSGLGLVENPTKYILLDYKKQRRVEEEMRVLYVALTRAREQLYVVGTLGLKKDDFLLRAEMAEEFLSDYSVYNLSSYLDMIVAAVGTEHKSPEEFLDEMPSQLGDGVEKGGCSIDMAESEADSDTDDGRLSELFALRFGFEYPTPYLTRLPSKLSVSKLYPAILDDSYDEPVTLSFDTDGAERKEKRGKKGKRRAPDFIDSEGGEKSREMGIATHLVLQFCELDRLSVLGAEDEVGRLVSEHYISQKDKELVRLDEVELFRRSRLIERMKGARRIYREQRFNVLLPAEMFTADEEAKRAYEGRRILVQGVIDCLIEDERGEFCLVDYKTDRLTKEELAHPQLAKKRLKASHALQLYYYSKAVERMFGKPPSRVEVYSLPLGDTVDVRICSPDELVNGE